MIRLTEEQIKILKEKYSTTTDIELCKELGLAYQTMRRKAKKLGLKKNRSKLSSEAMKKVWKDYKMFGVPDAIIEQVKKIGKDTCFKKGYNPKDGYTEEQWREKGRKISEKKKQIYAAERRRVLFGLPQKTKIKVRL